MSEQKKLERNEWYNPATDTNLINLRKQAEALCFTFNHTHPNDEEQKQEILRRLLPKANESIIVLAPFYADYGIYCEIKENSFINHNAYFMDGATIKIGMHCFIGPNCGMYTAQHPLCVNERNTGLEKALPITIEDNVWIGGDVTILFGVTIGKGSIIGAKSLVTHSIPPNVIAFGNPCRVHRVVTENDRIKNKSLK